jgi:hypothetical protein
MRRLVNDSLLIRDQAQSWLDLPDTDTLDALNAASIRYRVAIGPGAGGRTLTLMNPGLHRTDTEPKPFTVDRDGFSLNASVVCQSHQRQRLIHGFRCRIPSVDAFIDPKRKTPDFYCRDCRFAYELVND